MAIIYDTDSSQEELYTIVDCISIMAFSTRERHDININIVYQYKHITFYININSKPLTVSFFIVKKYRVLFLIVHCLTLFNTTIVKFKIVPLLFSLIL